MIRNDTTTACRYLHSTSAFIACHYRQARLAVAGGEEGQLGMRGSSGNGREYHSRFWFGILVDRLSDSWHRPRPLRLVSILPPVLQLRLQRPCRQPQSVHISNDGDRLVHIIFSLLPGYGSMSGGLSVHTFMMWHSPLTHRTIRLLALSAVPWPE